MNIELIEAKESNLTVVQNLIRFYIYDMSEFMEWDCPENGLFGGVDDLPEYWGRKPENPHDSWTDGWKGIPYLVRVDDALAGFALIRWLDQPDQEHLYDIGEFFILRKYRGKDVGKWVAHTLFAKYQGRWQVRQLSQNKPAQHFWRSVISQYNKGIYQEIREYDSQYKYDMVVQRFDSKK